MKTLRNPLVWQALFGIALLLTLIANQPTIAALVPALVVIAMAYVGGRLIWVLAQRRARSAAGPGAPPALLAAPPITGEIAAETDRATIDPATVQSYLSSRVIGQDEVIEQLTRGIWRRLAQERRGKPVFTALLSGPTGTGKTELAKALADVLFGGGSGLFRVDCANVIGEAGLQTLIGSPKGYAGSGTWGALTGHLRAMPRTVLLFDEIEKAVTSPQAPMAKLLLSLLDEGVCTEQSDGTRVSATDSVIVMTSNAAQDKLRAVHEQLHDKPDELVRATKDTLRDFFAPEFLARIDLVTTLGPIGRAGQARIIAMHVGRIAMSYGVEVAAVDASFVNEALRRWSALEGYGTREVVRWVEEVSADQLIGAKQRGIERVRIVWADGSARVESA